MCHYQTAKHHAFIAEPHHSILRRLHRRRLECTRMAKYNLSYLCIPLTGVFNTNIWEHFTNRLIIGTGVRHLVIVIKAIIEDIVQLCLRRELYQLIVQSLSQCGAEPRIMIAICDDYTLRMQHRYKVNKILTRLNHFFDRTTAEHLRERRQPGKVNNVTIDLQYVNLACILAEDAHRFLKRHMQIRYRQYARLYTALMPRTLIHAATVKYTVVLAPLAFAKRLIYFGLCIEQFSYTHTVKSVLNLVLKQPHKVVIKALIAKTSVRLCHDYLLL